MSDAAEPVADPVQKRQRLCTLAKLDAVTLEGNRASLARTSERIQAQIEALQQEHKSVRERETLVAEAQRLAAVAAAGSVRFSDDGFLDALDVDEIWRVTGSVNAGPAADAECPARCMSEACRFACAGVRAEPDVPVYHVQDATHGFCLALCLYCMQGRRKMARDTAYWRQHFDDGYGGKLDWAARPFCALAWARVPDGAAAAVLACSCEPR